MRRRPTIFLADDHSLFSEVVRESLAGHFEIAGSAHDAGTALREIKRLKPDLVIFDVSMPMLNGLELAMQVHEVVPSTRVMFLAMGRDAAPASAVKIGSLGILAKASGASELPSVIWKVLLGEPQAPAALFEEVDGAEGERRTAYLTSREKEVVQLLAEGKPMKQVADLLNVSTRTIAFHKYGVMRKLGLNSSAELIRMAVSQGLVA